MSRQNKCDHSMSKQNKYDHIKDDNHKIETMCNTPCQHQQVYVNNSVTDPCCSLICDTIHNCYAQGKLLTNKTISTFLKYICKTHYYYTHINSMCIYKNKTVLVDILTILFGQCIPPIEIFKELIQIPEYDVCYNSFSENPEFIKFDDNYIDIIINNRLKYSCINDDTYLVQILMKHMDMTTNILHKLCSCRSEMLSNVLSGIIDKFSGDITEDFLLEACEGLPYTKRTIESLKNRGFQLNEKHLEIVCSKCNIESIEYILQLSRMPIIKTHFTALVTSKNYVKSNDGKKEFNGRYGRSTMTLPSTWEAGYTIEKMELLIKYGYVPDYDDVLFGIKNKVEIPNIERFSIPLDQQLLDLCWANDFYPQYNFSWISSSMIELQKLCMTKRLKDIKLLVKKNNLVPDRKCMENASRCRNNVPIYDYLTSIGGKVTYKCVQNCTKEMKDNKFLIKLANDYENIYINEINSYKDKIEKLEQEIIKLGGSKTNSIPEPIIEGVNGKVETPKNIKKITKSVNKKAITNIKKTKNIELTDDDDDNNNNDNNNDNNNGNNNDNNNNDNNNNDDNNNNYSHVELNINILDSEILEIQKKYRLKSQPPNNFTKIFGIEKNNGKMSYTDIKKYVLNKIKTDDWFYKNDKSIINLPENIRKIFNLNENEGLSFSDIDKFVCLFYI